MPRLTLWRGNVFRGFSANGVPTSASKDVQEGMCHWLLVDGQRVALTGMSDPCARNCGLPVRACQYAGKCAGIACGAATLEVASFEDVCVDVSLPDTNDGGIDVKVIELPAGALLLPGFIDAHCHVAHGGLRRINCNLEALQSLEEMVDVLSSWYLKRVQDPEFFVKSYWHPERNEHWKIHDARPEGEGWIEVQWCFASGFDDAAWSQGLAGANEGRSEAPRVLLDSSMGGNVAVLIRRIDGHAVWANSLALKIAGLISPDGSLKPTSDSARHVSSMVESIGNRCASGLLCEDAMELLYRTAPQRKDYVEFHGRGLESGFAELVSSGIVAVHDALVRPRVLDAWIAYYNEAATKRRAIPLASLSAYLFPKEDLDIDWVDEAIARLTVPSLRVRSAKFMLDGVLESRTAFVSAPYARSCGMHEDPHPEHGIQHYETSQLGRLVAAMVERDVDLHFHAVGDAATTQALDLIEKITSQEDRPVLLRAAIAHVQLVKEYDLVRMAKFGVWAVMSPLWCFRDHNMCTGEQLVEKHPAQLPHGQYPIRAMLDTGVRVAFGSDYPVSAFEPLHGIEVAITHRAPGDTASEIWNPGQRISLAEAVRAYTIDAARSCSLQGEVGNLESGKLASFVILDQNLFSSSLEPCAVNQIRVLGTTLSGSLVTKCN